MDGFWGALGALLAVVAPMALAGWLLARPGRRRSRPPADGRGKMPRDEGG